jgi:streptogramin lyase
MMNRMAYPTRVAPIFALLALLAATIFVTSGAAASGGVRKFKTPTGPAFLLIQHGAVWVAGHRGGPVYKLDPKTNRITKTIRINDDVFDLAPAGRYFQVWSGPWPSYLLIDPRTGKIVKHVTDGTLAIHWGGSTWKAKPNNVLARLDRKTHVVLKKFHIPDGEGPMVQAAGSLWIPGNSMVTRIELATNTLTVIPLPGGQAEAGPNQGYAGACHLAVTPGKIWIGNPAGIYYVRVATNEATVIPGTTIGNLDQWGCIGIYAARGSVFARTGPSTVTRIDATTDAIVSHYTATGGGGDVAVGFGSLWVTNFGTDSTWREAP